MKKAIQSCLVVFVVFFTACNRSQKIVKITDNLTWVCADETESSLLWNQKVIIGPGSITLKCDKIYAWGMIHKKNISTFFMLNLKTGEIITNPEMIDVVCKYNVNVDFNQSYTQAEIFGDQKSMSSIKQLENDIKMLNKKK